jgi:ferritin heavy chain
MSAVLMCHHGVWHILPTTYLPLPTASLSQAASEEEREHAEQLMEYQNVRGGRVRLASMLQPETEFNHDEKVRQSKLALLVV